MIQKHAATRLHYDLRLELDGVFKSWAVTRGPSLDPHDKRLAVEVEDHPLDYGDFEGTIPKGQYGGGTVQLWDRGYWEPEGGIEPEQALAKGDLKFVLEGERLHGSWVLVRMKHDRSGGKRTNWLLIKHRDECAEDGDGDALLDEDRSVASGRTMAEIAAGKGRGAEALHDRQGQRKADAVWQSEPRRQRAAGRTAPQREARCRPPRPRTVARSCPISSSRSCASRVERPPTGAGWVHEIKFDGYRMQLRVEDGKATLRTRKGLDWTDKFPAIASGRRGLPDCIIDGEIVALDHNGAPDFAALQAALSDGKTEQLIFFAFDLLFAGGEDLRALPLSRAQGAAEEAAASDRAHRRMHPLRRAFQRRRCGAAVGLPHVAGRHRLQAARRALSLRPQRHLDQVQVPRRPRSGDRRLDHDRRNVPLAAGRASIAAIISSMSAASAPASARTR